jgi:hypothetical protein
VCWAQTAVSKTSHLQLKSRRLVGSTGALHSASMPSLRVPCEKDQG